MKILIAGNMNPKIIHSLEQKEFELFFTHPLNALRDGLEYHPDMQVARVDDIFICEPGMYDLYSEYAAWFGKTLIAGDTFLQCNYPGDIAYNIKVVSDHVFHNFKYTDKTLTEAICKKNKINIAQGYSGCSICAVGGDAVISADPSVVRACIANGIDCLEISAGHIELKGFEYGFIGGAGFVYENVLYIFGSLKNHPDNYKIRKFCFDHKTEVCFLSDDPAEDFGSAIVID